MSEPDLLFSVRNNFYLGAFQAAIAEASDLEGLSDAEKVERDCYIYRAYIELGSYEVSLDLCWPMLLKLRQRKSLSESLNHNSCHAACDQ